MNIGIVGLPQSGKKTLFKLLAGEESFKKQFDPHKALSGVAEVVDPRFDTLVSLYAPKKQVRSRLEVTLVPKIEEQAISQGTVFKDMESVDALCHVVRLFEDDAVYHLRGSVDAARDIEFLNNELLLHDLVFVEKRLERIEHNLKKIKEEAALRDREVLLEIKAFLESERPLRFMDLSQAQTARIASYPLLTRKQMIVVLNVAETDLHRAELWRQPAELCERAGIACIPVAAAMESEIALLDTAKEREQFMSEMGIAETALTALTRMCIQSLGLVSFFTVGRDEVRQWFVRRGSTVAEAAGTIHSDMQRGFIRAEVIRFEDLVRYGSEEKVKSAGKFYLKGREYIVEDGDTLGIRFSV